MMNDERTVKIPVSEYEMLVAHDTVLGILIDAIYSDAKLHWDKTSLDFKDEHISKLMPCITGGRYKREFKRLIDESKQEADDE